MKERVYDLAPTDRLSGLHLKGTVRRRFLISCLRCARENQNTILDPAFGEALPGQALSLQVGGGS